MTTQHMWACNPPWTINDDRLNCRWHVGCSSVAVGTRILHERFGKGVVTAVSGSGIDTKATVNFENVGVKQLLLRFAKFKVI